MFEQPAAKRVRRDELYGSDSSEDGGSADEMDIELRAQLNDQIAQSLGLGRDEMHSRQDTQTKSAAAKDDLNALRNDDKAGEGEESADEFEFQLFSTSEPTAKVILEDEDLGDGALVRRRPESYYLATRIPDSLKQEFVHAAVTAEQILERSTLPSWGLQLPWKVVHVTGTAVSTADDAIQEGSGAKGKRPGKKKRIAMRVKARQAQEKAKSAKEKAAEKEEHLKDKKKRLNRLKKLRRRAKKKAEGGGGDEGGDDSDDSA